MLTLTRIPALLLWICCSVKTTHAQSEKNIYAMVLDSLYSRPTAAMFVNELPSEEGKPHYVYVDRHVLKTPMMLSKRRRYVDFLKGRSSQITVSGLRDVSTCPFDKSRYCYRIIDNGRALDYKKRTSCTLNGNSNALPLRRYTFSAILYTHKKKNGLLVVRQQKGNDSNESILWFVSLQSDVKGWNIADISYRVE